MSRFWSPVVHDLTPYVPGEQPKLANLVKLNTNENPYPPSPHVLAAIRAELGDDAQIGFHGHENLDIAVANSVNAVRAGAQQIDGSIRRFGAGAGNTPTEAFVGVCDKLGITTGIDFMKIADAAQDVVRPAMPSECLVDRSAMMMGYAGCYSSFLKHAENHAERAAEREHRRNALPWHCAHFLDDRQQSAPGCAGKARPLRNPQRQQRCRYAALAVALCCRHVGPLPNAHSCRVEQHKRAADARIDADD